MRSCILPLCLALLAPAVARAQAPSDRPDATMQNLVDDYAKHHHGKVSLYAKAMRTGQTVAIDPDVPVSTASVIKLAIMLEAMYQVKEGRVSFNDMLPLKKEDQVSGSGVLLLFHTPAEINFETAIVLMITQSDNTAANLVLEHVGRERVNARMRSLGFKLTTSIRPIGHPGSGDQSPELKPFGIGRTTAREMAGILEAIDRCDLGDKTLCARMIDILEHQFWRNCIPHYLEDADTTEVASHVANKTGSLDHVRNDVGIVYTKDGPIVISAFTYDNADTSWTPENEGELLIARMARTIVAGWAPHGLGKEMKYPDKPITILAGYGPGSGGDRIARAVAEAARKYLSAPIVVVNRVGAAGTLAISGAINAQPDGYTLGLGTAGTLTLQPHETPLSYAGPDTYTPIAKLVSQPNILMVKAGSRWTSARQFLADARAHPGALTIGVPGAGTVADVNVEQLKQLGGFDLKVVFFDGPKQVDAVLGGQIDASLAPPGPSMPSVRAGKAVALAVVSEHRLPLAPDVPTLKDLGFDVTLETYQAIIAPRGTPETVVRTLDEALRKIVSDPSFVSAAEATQSTIDYKGPSAFAAELRQEFQDNGKLIRSIRSSASRE